MFTIFLTSDDFDDMLIGIADTKEKADAMVEKLHTIHNSVFEDYEYKIIPMKINTITVDDIDYTF